MAKLLGLKSRKEDYPVIEIVGPPSVGKSLVAKHLANRLGGAFIRMPKLGLLDPIERSLTNLYTNTHYLEQNPAMWLHIYSGVLTLYTSEIERLKKIGPVVLTNYVNGQKAYASALGIKDFPEANKGFNINTSKVNNVYVVKGRTIKPNLEAFDIKFSYNLTEKLESYYRYLTKGNFVIVPTIEDLHVRNHIYLKDCINYITSDVIKKHRIPQITNSAPKYFECAK